MKALVSIHDVMPHTLDRVTRIITWLGERGAAPVTLLVVPGRSWQAEQISHLNELAKAGHTLAAHGWLHESNPRRLYHRLHAALISRRVAEHLDLDSKNILNLLNRSRNWFKANNLPVPDFYVPPAWALGPITKTDLAQAPYKLIETTRGLLYLNSGISFQRLPLTGYEADTPFREFFLRPWNAAQARSAIRKELPLRISIHPDDLELRIADQLDQQIQAVQEFLPYPRSAPMRP